jgi:uncharacterized membrane protein YeiH
MCLRSGDQKKQFTSMDQMTQIVANYIGDASFAITGSLAAGMEGMDLLGCVIVGFVTALGGGTIRDIFLGRLPLFWMTAWDEFLLVTSVGTATFFLWPPLSMKFKLTSSGEWLFWTDAIGLGVFAAAGASVAVAHDAELHTMACACCGMFTATFGGMTRDVLIARPPRILYNALELYAVPALLGGLATSMVLKYGETDMVMEAIMLGVWITIHARVFAVNHELRLPTFPAASVYSKDARPRDAAAERAREEDRSREGRSLRGSVSGLLAGASCFTLSQTTEGSNMY